MLCKRQFTMTFHMIYTSAYKGREKRMVWLNWMSSSLRVYAWCGTCETAAAKTNWHDIKISKAQLLLHLKIFHKQYAFLTLHCFERSQYWSWQPISKRQTYHFTFWFMRRFELMTVWILDRWLKVFEDIISHSSYTWIK